MIYKKFSINRGTGTERYLNIIIPGNFNDIKEITRKEPPDEVITQSGPPLNRAIKAYFIAAVLPDPSGLNMYIIHRSSVAEPAENLCNNIWGEYK